MKPNIGMILNQDSLYTRFGRLKDKRQAKEKRYTLAIILVGIVLAKLCRGHRPSEIAAWVTLQREPIVKMLALKHKQVPSHHTHRRILVDILDVQELGEIIREYRHYGICRLPGGDLARWEGAGNH